MPDMSDKVCVRPVCRVKIQKWREQWTESPEPNRSNRCQYGDQQQNYEPRFLHRVLGRRLTSRAQAQPPEGQASNGMMMFKFHVPVKTERAVAVACSELLGVISSLPPCLYASHKCTPNSLALTNQTVSQTTNIINYVSRSRFV
jgi:hypothetical protein